MLKGTQRLVYELSLSFGILSPSALFSSLSPSGVSVPFGVVPVAVPLGLVFTAVPLGLVLAAVPLSLVSVAIPLCLVSCRCSAQSGITTPHHAFRLPSASPLDPAVTLPMDFWHHLISALHDLNIIQLIN